MSLWVTSMLHMATVGVKTNQLDQINYIYNIHLDIYIIKRKKNRLDCGCIQS